MNYEEWKRQNRQLFSIVCLLDKGEIERAKDEVWKLIRQRYVTFKTKWICKLCDKVIFTEIQDFMIVKHPRLFDENIGIVHAECWKEYTRDMGINGESW